MFIHVRLPYLDTLPDMSYSTEEDLPVFLNGDLLNPVGCCQMIDTEDSNLLHANLWLDVKVSTDLFMYYLQDMRVRDCFHFGGIHLLEKRLRRVNRREKVILMPRYEAGKEKRTRRLRDVLLVVYGG